MALPLSTPSSGNWIGLCREIAKLVVNVGEFLPLCPYVKGSGLAVQALLDAIETLKKNKSDLKALVTRIAEILRIVHEAMSVNGDASGDRFETICVDFQQCLDSFTIELTDLERKGAKANTIKRYLISSTIQGTIEDIRERAEHATTNLSLNLTLDSRMAVAKVDSMAGTILYQSLEATGSISAVRSGLDDVQLDFKKMQSSATIAHHDILSSMSDMHQEVQSLQASSSSRYAETQQVLHSIHADAAVSQSRLLSSTNGVHQDVLALRAETSEMHSEIQGRSRPVLYNRSIYSLIDADLYLIDELQRQSDYRYIDARREYRRTGERVDYKAEVTNCRGFMTARIYTGSIRKDFVKDIQRHMRMRHPRLLQLYGVCESENLHAIVFHGTPVTHLWRYQLSLTNAQERISFCMQAVIDFASAAEALQNDTGASSMLYQGTTIAENGRILITDFVDIYQGHANATGNRLLRWLPEDRFVSSDLGSRDRDSLTPRHLLKQYACQSHSSGDFRVSGIPPNGAILFGSSAGLYDTQHHHEGQRFEGQASIAYFPEVKQYCYLFNVENRMDRLSDTMLRYTLSPGEVAQLTIRWQLTSESQRTMQFAWYSQAQYISDIQGIREPGNYALKYGEQFNIRLVYRTDPHTLCDTSIADSATSNLTPKPVYCFISRPRLWVLPVYFSWDPTGASQIPDQDVEQQFSMEVCCDRSSSSGFLFDTYELRDFNSLHLSYDFNPSSTEIAEYLGLPFLKLVYPPINVYQKHAESVWSSHLHVIRDFDPKPPHNMLPKSAETSITTVDTDDSDSGCVYREPTPSSLGRVGQPTRGLHTNGMPIFRILVPLCTFFGTCSTGDCGVW